VVREKVKIKTLQLFRRVRRFASKFYHFPHFTRKMKVIQLFKAKMEAFRDKKSKKVKNDQNSIHLALVLAVEMKTVFSTLAPETLRKPMVSLTFC